MNSAVPVTNTGAAMFSGSIIAAGDGNTSGGRWLGPYQSLNAIITATIPGGPQLGDFVNLRDGGFASYCGTPPSWQPVAASTLAPI